MNRFLKIPFAAGWLFGYARGYFNALDVRDLIGGALPKRVPGAAKTIIDDAIACAEYEDYFDPDLTRAFDDIEGGG